MSEHKPKTKPAEPKSFGWMAEYEDENQLLDAARKVRDSGYSRTDAFTPFPVHGIDEALGIKPTVLPWFTLVAGATGTTVALVMQIYLNAVDYPYIISGKPFVSLPAFIPVAFELTVLFAAFTTVFAMLGLNGLPMFSNPVFTNPKFDRVTDDRFFLWVDSRDKYFNSDKVKNLLAETGALGVDEVKEDDSPTQVPRQILVTIFTLIMITLIPGAIILNMRNSKSSESRFHVFFDMDFQPKRKTQTRTTLFADSRVQRPPVPGTVARGDLELADPYYLGYEPEQVALVPAQEAVEAAARLVSFQQDQEQAPKPKVSSDSQTEAPSATDESAIDEPAPEESSEPAAAAAGGEPDLDWLETMPIEATEELFALGQAKFEQNCAVCHGYSGYGNGLVSERANNLAQGYWVTPTSMHEERIQQQPVGRIYYTITNGKGKMGGYKASLTPKERWAIVLYIRALQRSQNAKDADVPAGVELTKVLE